MSARIFVDTNVLAYLFDDSEPKKKATARRRLESAHAEHELVLSTQVLQELYVALTRGAAPIATHEIAERAVREAARWTLVQVDLALVLSAIEARARHHISFWDALVVCAAVQAGCSTLLTEDMNDGQVFDGVRVESPFR